MSSIYELVEKTFFKLGMPPPIDVYETLLVDDGYFIGHKFHCDGGYAILGLGSSAVEFYDEDGNLLTMVTVRKPLQWSA